MIMQGKELVKLYALSHSILYILILKIFCLVQCYFIIHGYLGLNQMLNNFKENEASHYKNNKTEVESVQLGNTYIADMDKCPQDKLCLDKCRGDSCNLL